MVEHMLFYNPVLHHLSYCPILSPATLYHAAMWMEVVLHDMVGEGQSNTLQEASGNIFLLTL